MKMKKKLLAVLLAVCCTAAFPASFALADGERVVTLGADLDEDQRETILRFFGIEGESIETLIITNEDERAHLADYIPLEQIGTRTVSCAYVRPTSSGGIQVKTANLTYVTSNMIASVLSTSGVVNCEVLAASPFEVSGTGALTGILMAYESASGENLPEEKKDAATQELVTVTKVADDIGQLNATKVVNNTKIEVIENNIDDRDEINNVVNNVTNEMNVTINDDDRELIVDLMEQIAQLQYDYDDMKTTLERVEDNINEQLGLETESEAEDEAEEEETEDPDSILNNTDDSVFDDDMIDSTTENDSPAQEESEDDSGLVITTTDSYSGDGEDTVKETEAAMAPDEDAESADASDSEDADTADDSGLSWDDSYGFDTDEDAGAGEDEEPATQAEDQDEAAAAEENESSEETIDIADLTLSPRDETVEAGLNVLTIASSGTDLVAGSGTLTIYDADSGETVESIAMDDSSKVAVSLTDSGTEFLVYLSEGLAPDTDYSVSLSEDAITNAEGTLAFTSSSDWTFSTKSYGIALQESVSGISAGTEVTGLITLDPESMAYALIDGISCDGSDVSDSVSLSESAFSQSGSFEISFPEGGKYELHVSFYDSADTMNYLGDASCTADVE